MATFTVPVPRGPREWMGRQLGRIWAPGIALVARARQARMFHPDGVTYAGHAQAIGESPLAPIGHALAGRVLARCSAALWRGQFEHLDVLGIGLRFRAGDGAPLDDTAAPGDQDLLVATIRSPLTLFGAPLVTDVSDQAGNRYWAVSPFAVAGLGRVELRLAPVEPPHSTRADGTREARLAAAVAAGHAAWWLEARRTLTLTWHRVARITLTAPVAVDQAALKFDPFRAGAGLVPVGLIHAIRRAAYTASQRARPQHGSR